MSATTKTSPYGIYRVTWVILLVITVAMLAAERFHLRAHRARVAMFSRGGDGPKRIFVEPLPVVEGAK